MKALILGGADCIWDDLDKAEKLGEYDYVIAANDIGVVYPGRIDWWVTLHPEKLDGWVAKREDNGHEAANACATHWNLYCPYAREIADRWEGSSGLYAVQIAHGLGCDKIVLCGIPMNESPHFFDKEVWATFQIYWKNWHRAHEVLKDKVRSFTGNTHHVFGEPSAEWFNTDG